MTHPKIPWFLWLRSLFYMMIVGGGWLVVLPLLLLLLETRRFEIVLRSPPFVVAGLGIFAGGVLLALITGWYLLMKGHGTPFPLDPTQELVTEGPYAYVRNPQGIAMMLMVTGEVLGVNSWLLWLLLPLTLFYLEVLVGPWEERQLLRQYGERYARYRRRVRKWLPSPPPGKPRKE